MKQTKNVFQSSQKKNSNENQSLFNLNDTILNDIYEKWLQITLANSIYVDRYYNQLLNQGKKAIDEQFLQRRKKIQIQSKLMLSNKINQCQMKKAKARFTMCEQVFKAVLEKLNIFLQQNQSEYCLTLVKFIVEGALRMFEQQLMIKCLDRDVEKVQKVLESAEQTFNAVMEEQTGRTYPIKFKINQRDKITLRNLEDKDNQFNKKKQEEQCIGGVILTDLTGNITYKNTIDARVNILREICLPIIRVMLWPNLNKNDSNDKSI